LIVNEIALVYYCQKIFGNVLLQDEKFRILLLRLDQNIETTQNEMAATGVVNAKDILRTTFIKRSHSNDNIIYKIPPTLLYES
jgi:hypothetical protein